MNWLQRLKAKHWDVEWIADPPTGIPMSNGGADRVPRFRAGLRAMRADLFEHRWIALTIVGAIIAALIS